MAHRVDLFTCRCGECDQYEGGLDESAVYRRVSDGFRECSAFGSRQVGQSLRGLGNEESQIYAKRMGCTQYYALQESAC